MVRSQSRVGAGGALRLAVVALAAVAFAAPLFAIPSTALAYYGAPSVDDSFNITASYYCQLADPGSDMTPAGFAVAPDGSMWIAENDSSLLGEGRSALVHLAGTGLLLPGGVITLPSDFTALTSATFGPDGKLYMGCYSTQSVLVYDTASEQVVSQIGDSSVFDNPVDLDFDANGNLFVLDPFRDGTDTTAGRVVRYNSTFTSYTTFNGTGSPEGALAWPHGLSIDALGNVWVADSGKNRIVEFDNSGSSVLSSVEPQTEGADALNAPQDIYVDGYDTLYIVDQTSYADGTYGRFVRYGADGTFLGQFRNKPVGHLNGPSKIWVNSPVYGGQVFVDDQIDDTGSGVGGLIERWTLTEAHPDLVAPVTTDTAPTGWQHGTVQVALSATDAQSGVASTVWGYAANSMSSYTSTITVAAEGVTTIYYRSTDKAGNVEPLHTIHVQIDRNAPVTTTDVPPIFYGTVSGSLTASDSVSGLATTQWRVDAGQWVTGTVLVLPSSFGTHTIDFYSADNSGLTETTHHVVYQVLNQTQQDDWRVLNQGAWSTVTTDAALGNSYETASTSGDRSIVTFKGTRLDYYAAFGPAYGKANLRIDGVSRGSVDLYAPTASYKQLAWTTGAMVDATHTIEVSWSGSKNASSSATTINVDAYDTAGYVGQADTDPPITSSDAPVGWVRPDLYVTLSATDTVSGVAQTYYSTDGSTPSLVYSAPIKFSADAITTFKFRSVDRVGNVEATHTATLRVDGTPPDTTCTVQPSYLTSATFVLVPTDLYSGVAQTLYSLDGSAAASGTVVTTSVGGSHTLSFRSTDIAGNAEATKTVAFDVLARNDQNAAQVYYRGSWSTSSVVGTYGGTAASLNSAGGAYFTFTGTRLQLRSPSGPAMGQAQVMIDGVSAGVADFYSAVSTPQTMVFGTSGLANTPHVVQLLWLGTKAAASTGTTIGLDSIDILGTLSADTQPPVTSDNSNGMWAQHSVTVALSASDASSWVATTYISVAGSTTVYAGPKVITNEGTTTVQYWSVDGAGNIEATHTIQVRVDNTPPTSADNIPATWQRVPIPVSLIASDTGAGVQKILYTVGNSDETLYTAPFVVSQEGSIPVEYYAVDTVTNAEALHTTYALLDMSAPVTTDNAPAGWVKNPVDVSLVATDTYSGVAQTLYGLNGAVPSLVATSPIHFAAEGTSTIAYRTTDVAGNVEATHSATVRIDATAPHTTSNCVSSYATTASVTLVPTDPASGVAVTQWRIDGSSWTTGTAITLPFVAGLHTLEWRSTDVAGNVETIQSQTYQMMQRWEQTDARFYFMGTWSTTSWSGGSYAGTNASGSSLFLNFTGTRFDLIGPTGPTYGVARVTIDGSTITNVDEYRSSVGTATQLYSAPGLTNVAHTVRLDWTGSKNASSSGTGIAVDAIDLIGQLNTDTVAPTTTCDATSAWRSTNATITLNGSDANSFVANSFYRIGSTTTTYTPPFVISTEGTTTFTYWSVDAAGNVEASSSAMVRIDRTAPVTSSDSTSSWQKGPVAVHLTAAETGSGLTATYYSLDGSNPSLVATNGLVTISAEGTTTLKYKSVDVAGNSEVVKTTTVRIDNTVPSTANDASGSWVKSPALVTLTGSDALSGIANTYYSTDGTNPTFVTTGPITIANDGTTTLKYYSRDNAGNAETTKSVSVKVDAVAPVTSATVATEYASSASIPLSATDAESGVATTKWRLDGGTWTTGSTVTTTAPGTHALDYYSTDVAGNAETVHSVSFDLTRRYDSASMLRYGTWSNVYSTGYYASYERQSKANGAFIQFVFSGTGFHLIGSRTASTGGTGTVTLDDGVATYTVDFSASPVGNQQRVLNVTGLTDTQHTVRLTCTNPGGTTRTIRLDAVDVVGILNTTNDITPPDTASNADALWHKGSFSVALNATDTISDVASTTYSLNGGAWQSYVGTFTVSTEGTNVLQYYSTDTATPPNQEATQTDNVLVDASAPVSTCDAASGWLTAPVIVHLSASDPYSGLAGTKYSVNGSAAATYTTAFGVSAEGTTTIAYASTDNVGNVEATKTAQVRLDFTTPVTSSNATSSYVNTATINLTPSDSGSGVANTSWRLDGSAWTSGTVVTTTVIGSHTLEYSSTDGVGHVETMNSVTFDVLKRFENTDARITYQGTWSTALSGSRSGGDWALAAVGGTAAYMDFHGTGIDLISSRGAGFGIAKVTLDGTITAMVDFYSPTSKHQQICWASGPLADADHLIKVEWTGSQNASSTGASFGIDAFDIIGAPLADTAPPVTSTDATSAWRTTPATISLSATDAGSYVRSTRYTVDASQAATYTAPFLVSGEGTTTIRFASTDGAGNAEATKTVLVRIDRVAPTTTDDAPNDWAKGPVAVHLPALDAGSGVAQTRYSTDGSLPSITASDTTVISAEGTTTLRYSSVDAVGNSESPVTRLVRVDSSAPISTDDAPQGWVSGPVSVHLSASDQLSGVAGIRYSLDGSQSATSTGPIALSTDGIHTITYAAVDMVGNVEGTHTVDVKIDATAPHTTDNIPAGWTAGPVLVSLDASDAVSGVAMTYYSADDSTPTLPYAGPVAISAQGTTTFKYYSVDVKGNAEAIASRSISIDDNAPTTADDAPANWVRGPVTVSLTATDSVSGVASTVYSLDGSTPTSPWSAPITISDEGTTTLQYRSYDIKGNAEAIHATKVLLDNSAPVTDSNAAPAYSNGATITLTPTDALSGVSTTLWSLDQGDWVSNSTTIATSVGGTHMLDWFSTDAAGNVESTHHVVFTVSKRIDDTDPSFVWRGSWATLSTPGSPYMGTHRVASSTGATAYFTFRGSSVTLVTAKGPDYGIASVSIDGTSTTDVDLYSSITPAPQKSFMASGLSDQIHTMSVSWTGRKNAASTNTKVSVDAADVVGTSLTDNVAPVTTSTPIPAWSKSNVTVSLSAHDDTTFVAATYYRVNSSSVGTYTVPLSFSTEGTTTLSFWSVDGAGNIEVQQDAPVRIDKSAPISTSDAPTSWVAAPLTLHLSATDPYSGLAGTRYTVNGSAVATYSAGVVISNEGTTSIAYASVDNVGNVETTKTATVRVDTTAPSTSSNATSSYLNTATVTLAPSDSGSGVAQTLWRLDASAWTSGTVVSTTAVGSHTLQYYSVDALGHAESTKSVNFDVLNRFENTDSRLTYQGMWATAVSSSRSGGDWAYASTSGTAAYLTFHGTSIQLISSKGASFGIARVTLDGGGSSPVDFYAPTSKHQQVCWVSGALPNGDHTIKVEWTGTQNASSTSAAFGIDAFDIAGAADAHTTPPVTTSDMTGAWRSTPATVTLSATDVGNYVQSTRYSVNGSAATTYTAPFAVAAEGTNTVQFLSTDGAGNVETTKTALVRIDRVAPVVSDNAAQGWIRSRVPVLLTATDTGSGVAAMLYSADQSDPTTPYSDSGIIPSAEGTTTIRYKAVDGVGNASATASTTVRVDLTPPVTTDDAQAGWVQGPFALHLSATDPLSGVAFTEAAVNGATLTTQTGPVILTGDGMRGITYRSTDIAGNVEQIKSTVVHVDSTPPTSTCNALPTYTATATISMSSVDALTGVAKIEYSLDEGAWVTSSTVSVSDFGTHTLRYRATDGVGNVETPKSATFAVYTTKRFENSDSRIYYQGPWTFPLSSSRSGGDWAFTNLAGTTAYVNFRGTGIQLISSKGSTFGIAKLTLDSVETTMVDFYSSTSKHQQVCWTSAPLAERDHTLKIEWTGTHNAAASSAAFGVDAFDITGYPLADTTPPITTSDAIGAWRSTPATVTLTATEAATFVRSTRYSVNGSAGATYTAPFAISSEGTTTIEFASTDGAGNVETTKTALVRIDRVAPTSSTDATSGYVATATINITATDAGSGVATSQYSLDGSSWTTGSMVTTSSPGSHTLNYRSADNLGNVESTKTVGFTVYAFSRYENSDSRIYYQGVWTTNISSSRSGGDWEFTNLPGTAAYVTFHGMSASLISSKGSTYGIAKVTLDSVETTMVDFYSPTSRHQQVVWSSGTLANGDHTIKIEWTGTQNANASSPSFGVDAFDIAGTPVAHTAPPVSTATYATGWQKGPVSVSLDATDVGNFVRAIRYGVNASINATYTSPLSFASDGQYSLYYRATDGAGNVESTRTALVRVDSTAPITSTNATGVFNAVAAITFTASDSLSGVGSTSYSLDGGDWRTGNSVSVTATGTHTIQYSSTDKAGNVESVKTARFAVAALTRFENTDPNLVLTGTWATALSSLRSGGSWAFSNISGSAASMRFNGTAIVLITSTGPAFGYARVTIDGGTPQMVDLYSAASAHQKAVWSAAGLADGTHTVTVERAGSRNPLSTKDDIGIDAFDIAGVSLAP